MSRKINALEQFLEVVGESDEVELNKAVVVVDARRVNISVDNALRMKVGYSTAQLSEHAKNLVGGKGILTELLPRGNMVRCFRLKYKSLNFVYEG